ncbi:hypothetical protein [Peptoclostridium litorale]|nr:hypothetical protein [Peptoclostridium litorale]
MIHRKKIDITHLSPTSDKKVPKKHRKSCKRISELVLNALDIQLSMGTAYDLWVLHSGLTCGSEFMDIEKMDDGAILIGVLSLIACIESTNRRDKK